MAREATEGEKGIAIHLFNNKVSSGERIFSVHVLLPSPSR